MTAANQTLPSVDISWDGQLIAWKDQENAVHHHTYDDLCFSSVPDLPFQDMQMEHLYLPMEWLLVRHVSLPLTQPNMVDAEMLFQELADSSDIDANDWWLTWRLQTCEEGIAGMVFGLPESLRASMQDNEQWSKTKEVLVDGYERLQIHLNDVLEQDMNMSEHGNKACLLLDQDAEGVFFGVYDGHVWRGMRRLNGDINDDLWLQLMCSSAAMGFNPQFYSVCGRANEHVITLLNNENIAWQGAVENSIQTRHELNFSMFSEDVMKKTALNLRHSSWLPAQGWGYWRRWKRSVFLSFAILLLWLLGMLYQIYEIDQQSDKYSQRIEAAFHQGLPNEPVMLDALAQLRQAAGGGTTRNETFLSSLFAVQKIYVIEPWQLSILELRDGEMYMAGEVKDIKTLNQMQQRLKRALQKDVRIVDTNMNGEKVNFRMRW